MSFYETLYIVDPNLENNALEKIMDEIGKELAKTKSKIINHRIWGKKRLAYQIDRQKYGSNFSNNFCLASALCVVIFSSDALLPDW